MSWSILLQAQLAAPVDPARVAAHLAEAVERHTNLGPAPAVEVVDTEHLRLVRDRFAGQGFAPGNPLVRVAVNESDPTILLAAHHAAIDGLGLVALLGLALDLRVASSATGLAERPAARSFTASAVRRVTEAMFAPPTRVQPVAGAGAGDVLVEQHRPRFKLGTAELVVAATAAVSGWNRARGVADGRIVAAVGTSRRGGAELRPEEASAFLRLRLSPRPDRDLIRRLLAEHAPEPDFPLSSGRLTRLATHLLAGRLGSSFLISNLGLVSAGPLVRNLSFFPVTSGRSGVAFGAATVNGTTTITLRARRRDFDTTAADELLHELVCRLPDHAGSATSFTESDAFDGG